MKTKEPMMLLDFKNHFIETKYGNFMSRIKLTKVEEICLMQIIETIKERYDKKK